MKRFILCMASIALILSTGCHKSDELRDDLDKLEVRVALLEQQIGGINNSINALHKLMQESTVIVGCQESEKGYTLYLSDGTSIEIIVGEQIPALVPILSIDQDGYWVYTLDNGKSMLPLTDNQGNRVSALPTTAEGSSPRLRIDSRGYWEYTIDGSEWLPMLVDGKPVSAVADNTTVSYSSFFESVKYSSQDGTISISLLSGQTLKLAVIDTFALEIKGVEGARFALGETRNFSIESRGVQGIIIDAPEEWMVVVEEDQLFVTAPKKNFIEKEVEIRLFITSEEGYLKVVKFSVVQLTTELDANACEAWNNFKTQSEENLLLDFSYAGYMHGEEAPKEASAWGYKVYNVVDYGADPTGKSSSREALIKLLKELRLTGTNANGNNQSNANAKAIIYFPEGEFVLHTLEDNTLDTSSDYKNQKYFDELGNNRSDEIFIRGGNLIIKGAGRDKTTLVMQSPNLPSNSEQMWSSPVMINIKHNSGTSELTTVTADAAKGSFSVEVASADALSKGDWVLLKLNCKDAACVEQELGPYHKVDFASMTDIQTIKVNDYHQIRSISGNTVTFYEPLMHAVEAKWGWTIHKYSYYENVGVEDLAFKGYSKSDFKHHGSWEDDGAYKPLNMMRLTNSWIRRVDFHDVSEAASWASCANCSAYDISIDGLRGHSAIRAQASSRIFIGKVVDKSSGKCVTPPAQAATEISDAGQYHASGVSETALGTVLWNNTWGEDAMFESHSRQPRATLVDNCHGGFVQWRFGGDDASVPNHLDDLTIWNFNAKSVKHDMGAEWSWWLESDRWWKTLPPIVVGFHGTPITFNQEPSQLKYEESNGVAVEPASLYEAQLRERLGYVPAWLNSLK